ncbi:MAG: hypothetical protein AAB832_00020, partial [Patescibacteria group bacterium]
MAKNKIKKKNKKGALRSKKGKGKKVAKKKVVNRRKLKLSVKKEKFNEAAIEELIKIGRPRGFVTD